MNLLASRLLEPAAGDGRFVAEAGRRLVECSRRMGLAPTLDLLAGRIVAYEFHARTADAARTNVAVSLRGIGVHKTTAAALARRWILTEDFLLSSASGAFTHVVGNPPYIRWSKIPKSLKAAYERVLHAKVTGGDLFLPFHDLSLDRLVQGGDFGFVCSDRWRFMAFASAFRAKWLPRLDIRLEETLLARQVFDRDVGAYPSILVGKKKRASSLPMPTIKQDWKLADAGYTVRVGPALGCNDAFVVPKSGADVEDEVLWPWIAADEIAEGCIRSLGRRVAAMHTNEGRLVDLGDFPLLAARLERHRKRLEKRAIVRRGALWYRPIDRVRVTDWTRPKLLV